MTTRTFAITEPIRVLARLGHGSFRVTALDDLSEATVVVSAGSADLLDRTTVELRGTTLRITSPRPGGILDLFGARPEDALDVEITVPSATPLKVSCVSADVVVTGRCGHADIATGTSQVSADFVDGELRLRNGSGHCEVARVSGSVQARSGSGTAHFGKVGGALTYSCGSGRLEIDEARGGVRFRAGSGAAVLGAIYDDIDLASGSGELRIGVPSGVTARLDLTTGSGRVESQLPVGQDAVRGGRSITIRARTGSGDVQLLRAAA